MQWTWCTGSWPNKLRQADSSCHRPNFTIQEKDREGEIKKNRNGQISNVRNNELGTEQRQKRNRRSGRHCCSVTFFRRSKTDPWHEYTLSVTMHCVTHCTVLHAAPCVVLSQITFCNPYTTLSVVIKLYILTAASVPQTDVYDCCNFL